MLYFQRALKLNPGYLSALTLIGHEYMEMKVVTWLIDCCSTVQNNWFCFRIRMRQYSPTDRPLKWTGEITGKLSHVSDHISLFLLTLMTVCRIRWIRKICRIRSQIRIFLGSLTFQINSDACYYFGAKASAIHCNCIQLYSTGIQYSKHEFKIFFF